MVILLGYMGSGKSSVGRALAQQTNTTHVDLDDYIEEKEGRKISEIFATKGEIYFRKREHECLKELLEKNPNIILSLGGGTPCYAGNMDLIGKTLDYVFYLKASIPELVSRLEKEKEHRPVISHLPSQEALTEFIGKHLFERSPFYSQANHTIVVDGKSIEEIVEMITSKLR